MRLCSEKVCYNGYNDKNILELSALAAALFCGDLWKINAKNAFGLIGSMLRLRIVCFGGAYMIIQEKKIKDLIPYENNPRKNDEAVEYVANSIREFGFKVPLVVDSNNVIVCGHTRYKAARMLKIDAVPCVVADDLTEEQIKAFRLADNKVAERSEWDFDLLNEELDGIFDIDMEDFDFEMPDEYDEIFDEPKENHRDATYKKYNLELIDSSRLDGFYQMPIVKKEEFIPDDLIGFNYMLTSKNKNVGIHCFIDDYQFERLWSSPQEYVEKIAEYDCFLSPDFSLYLDMPMAMKIWNIYRSRLIGQFMQDCGVCVIPTISWAEPETFSFCFAGIEKGSVVAVSTIGVKREEASFSIWKSGMDEMIRVIEPSAILVYGGEVEYDYQGINVVYYDNHVTGKMKEKSYT